MQSQPLAIIATAYRDVFENWTGLLRVGMLWVVATQGLGLAVDWTDVRLIAGGFLEIIVSIVEFVAWAAIAVTWHRHIILHEPLEGPLAPLNRKVFRYLLAEIVVWLIIGILGMVASLPLMGVVADAGFVGILLVGALVLGLFALAARFAVWFPAIAVDDRSVSWDRSIELTRGHTFSIAIGGVLAALPIALACLPALYLLASIDGMAMPVLTFLVNVAATLVSIAVTVAFLSLTYLSLARPPAEGINANPVDPATVL